MCLDTVDEKPNRRLRIGFKIVDQRENGYYSWDYAPMAGRIKYPVGKWLKDNNCKELGYLSKKYPAGFHIVLNKSRAVSAISVDILGLPNLKVVKCKFRKVVASGSQCNYGKVVVAKEIMLLGETA